MFTSSRPLSLIAIPLCALALAALPSAASAAERYVSPTGTGVGCTADKPCSLESAVGIASNYDDEVIVSPGDYPLTATIEDKARITIRSMPGQPHPRLLFSGASQAGVRLMNGSLLRDVDIEQAAQAAALTTSGARIDGVVVKGGGGIGDCSVNALNGILRDSIFVDDETPVCSIAYGVPNTTAFRNVTAVATQAGRSAILISATSGSADIDLTNVIAKAGAGGDGFSIITDVFGGPATVTATHSNFESYGGFGGKIQVVDGGGNEHAAPKFVNAAAGDYRQAAGSVTIDAGANAALNGAYDVDGDPRRIDTTDIGADEFVRVATGATGPATAIGPQSATLHGSVTAIGVPTSYRFEYGTTTAYSNETPATGVGGAVAVLPVAATLGGLNPGSTYHFRLVTSNKAGVWHGQDQSFTTAAGPVAPASPPPASPSTASASGFAGVTLRSTRLPLSGRFITLRLGCPAATVGGCSGQTKLSARRRSGSRRIALGKARFSIAAGGAAKVRLRVSRAGLQRLSGLRRLRARDANVAHDAAGLSKTTVANVTVRRLH